MSNKRRRFKAKRLRRKCERCGRRIRDHRGVDIPAIVRAQAREMARRIDAEALAMLREVYGIR